MSHEHYEDLVASYAFGKLDDAERADFERHLASGCERCRRELAEYEDFAADVELSIGPARVSATHRRRLFDAIRAETAVDAGGAERARTSAGTRAVSPVIPPRASPVSLVGRDRELAVVTARVNTVLRGEGSILSIEGEGGIGKSRLVAELEETALEGGATVLQGSSGAGGQDLGYQPFLECLHRWLGVGPEAGAEEARSALRESIEALGGEPSAELLPSIARLLAIELEPEVSAAIEGIEGDALERLIHRNVVDLFGRIARRRPLVLVFEDLHWADESSLSLLEAVATLVDTHAALIVTVSREGYTETSGRFLAHAVASHALRHHYLALRPLDQDGTRALIRQLLDSSEFPEEVADFVIAKCEGNPFYVEQIVRALLDGGVLAREDGRMVVAGELPAEGIGEAVTDVVARRVEVLGASERAVLEAAAVAGRYVHRRVLAEVVGADLDRSELAAALASLVERQFLVRRSTRDTSQAKVVTLAAEEGYVFKHVILRDAVYEMVAEGRRRRLHLRAAEAIERIFASRLHDFYALLAVHYARAGDAAKATDYLLEAGGHAAASAASVEALRLFREAHRAHRLAYGEGGPTALRARLEADLARALLNTGHLGESIAHVNNALRLHGQWVPESRAGLYAKLAWDVPNVLVRLYSGRLAHARGQIAPEVREVYSLMYDRCRAQNIVDAERNFFDNFAVFHYGARHGDPMAVDHAAGFLAATGAFFAFSGLSFGVGRRFLDLAREVAARGPRVDGFLYRAMAFVYHFHRGDWDPEHDIDADMLAEGLRHGMHWDADVYLGMRCERDIRQGRWEEAERGIEQLRALCDDWGYGFARSNEYAQAAYLLAERRELEAATEALQRWYDSRQEDTLHLLALGTRAKIEVLQGKLHLAEQTLERADAIRRRDRQMAPYYTVTFWSARLRLAVARMERAVEEGRGADAATTRAARHAVRDALAASAKVFRERSEVLGLAARASWLMDKREASFALWRQAFDVATRSDVRPELARLSRDVGLALAPTPDLTFLGTDAGAWLDRARSRFTELGAQTELSALETEAKRRRKVA